MSNEKKYSIIIPCRNGAKYLPTCVETIISQEYDNYELIISDDHSADNTMDYLKTLKQPNIKVVVPPEGLSMAEHWEWALKQASGEWLIFVGQDDGLQSYFFKLADKLTKMADEKKVRTIMSRRAYFFWKGCENYFGDTAVSYTARSSIKLLNIKWQSILALLGFKTYFELPEMYTTSLFKRSIIEEAMAKQNGSLFVTHPQDANLAAIACSLDKKYLDSSIPLGWVGTSPKSAGMAASLSTTECTSNNTNSDMQKVQVDYLQKTKQSSLQTHELTGDFTFGSNALYYWGALLKTAKLRESWFNRFIQSDFFKIIMFGGILIDVKKSTKLGVENRYKMFCNIIKKNGYSLLMIKMIYPIATLCFLINAIIKKTYKKISNIRSAGLKYRIAWNEYPENTMVHASKYVDSLIEKNRLFEKI
jgi:glycosyltransferase involved in cell wall biosynthesis